MIALFTKPFANEPDRFENGADGLEFDDVCWLENGETVLRMLAIMFIIQKIKNGSKVI